MGMPKWVKILLLALGFPLFLFAVIILVFENFNYGVIVTLKSGTN